MRPTQGFWRAKMYWNLIWKSPGFVRFVANLKKEPNCTDIWSKTVPDLSHLESIWCTLRPNLSSLVRMQGYLMLYREQQKCRRLLSAPGLWLDKYDTDTRNTKHLFLELHIIYSHIKQQSQHRFVMKAPPFRLTVY